MSRLLSVIFIGLFLLSCNKDNSRINHDGSLSMTINASLPELPIYDEEDNPVVDTKAATQYTVRIKWTKGDKLSVINLTSGNILGGSLISDFDGYSTTFSGSLKGRVSKGDKIAFIYPGQDVLEEKTFEGMIVDMSSQTGTMNDVPLAVYSIMTVESLDFENISIGFSFLMSYIMIGLSDLPSGQKIKSLTLNNISDSFSLALKEDKSGFNMVPHAGSITLNLDKNATGTGARTVYAAVPASLATTVRTVELETNTTTFSTIFTSATINNGYAYNINVTGFLVDDLVLADKQMREYCLTHFDKNGDGRLSLVEVAGVTSFPDQTEYPIPQGITSFNELEYFYSLTSLPTFKMQNRLESITIPKQIQSIPNDMFLGCSTLVKIYLKPVDPPILGLNAFYGVPDGMMLIVDDSSVSAYQTADGWKKYFNNFRTGSNQNASNINVDIEDDNSMDEEEIDITIK